ncbi:acyl-ACP--UDP-N-acetylglucosamine O-acyltransferase [Thermosulfuriphilus sp.]
MIHPTAIIHPRAEIASGVSIGAYTVIGEGVEIGPDCEIASHVVIEGLTRLGARNRIYPFVSIGGAPQHLKYGGEPTRVEIGDDNVIREYVTINRGTALDKGVTRIGNGCFLMAYVHVAHDCVLEDGVIMANAATLGGHVEVGERAILGGLVAIHQFCRIGKMAFVGGASGVNKDVPPFVLARGNPARLYGLNLVGLRRSGMATEVLEALRRAFGIIFKSSFSLAEALAKVREEVPQFDEIKAFVEFIENSERGVLRLVNKAEENIP